MSHNLPAQLTSFIGRERELADLGELLSTARLLTLTGSGGSGKTRLALRVAEVHADDYSEGVWLIELAALADGSLVAQAVASTLQVSEQARASLVEILFDALHSRHCLLVLDNCEHLLPAVAQFADGLLRACPEVRILTTSREALNIAGETTWRVPSLTLPAIEATASVERLRLSEAVQLFDERARSVLPGFALTDRNAPAVAELCRRLDGLPLALELAAARVRLLSAEQIAARLDDRFRLLTTGSRLAPTRQQTLEATIEWSYDLLSENEQELFDRLSVFAGGWSLEAAEAVTSGGGIEPREVLDLLGRLVDKSLAMAEPDEDGAVRYRLPETLRHYAQERLRGRGESEAVAGRHASFCVELAEREEEHLFGPNEPEAVNRLDAEHDNLRSALNWLIARGDAANGQRLGGALGFFWFFESYLTEGRTWLDQVLGLPAGGEPTEARARCLVPAAAVALGQGDFASMQARAEEALGLWRAFGNQRQATAALYLLGMQAKIRGENARAGELLEEAAVTGRRSGNHAFEALSLMWLAEMAASQGAFAMGRAKAEQARACAMEAGWARAIAATLWVLASACFEQGDDRSARALAEESVAGMRAHGRGPWFVAQPLLSLGEIAIGQRDFAPAHAALSEAVELSRRIGDRSGVAAGLQAFAYLAVARGDSERALRLAAAAGSIRGSLGGTMRAPSRRAQGEFESATGSLAPEVRRVAEIEGRAMGLEDTIAYAFFPGVGELQAGEQSAAQAGALTPREREVAMLVAQGLTNRQIADRLVLTEKTAANHVARIFDKLGVHSRGQLAARAGELDLLRPG